MAEQHTRCGRPVKHPLRLVVEKKDERGLLSRNRTKCGHGLEAQRFVEKALLWWQEDVADLLCWEEL
jgi:hypothetical protein